MENDKFCKPVDAVFQDTNILNSPLLVEHILHILFLYSSRYSPLGICKAVHESDRAQLVLVRNEFREYELFAVRVSHEYESARVFCSWCELETMAEIHVYSLVLIRNIHMFPTSQRNHVSDGRREGRGVGVNLCKSTLTSLRDRDRTNLRVRK